MAPYRHTSFISIAAILVWIIYYSQFSTFLSQPSALHHYDGHVHTDAEIDAILAADATATGSVQLKHHKSVSANRYDISSKQQRKNGQKSLDDEEESKDLLDAQDYRKMWQYPPQWSAESVLADLKGAQRSEDAQKRTGKPLSPGRLAQDVKGSQLYSATFPKQIWQCSSSADKVANKDRMRQWNDVNVGLEHSWMSEEEADIWVHETFSESRKSLVSVWDEIASGYRISGSLASVRSNLLRYLLLLIHGGIYTDIDTIPLLHADHYIPMYLTDEYVDAIIGLDFEDKGSVGFLTSTMVSKAYHPLFLQAVERVISNLEYLKHRQDVSTLAQLKLSKAEVNAATGPLMFTDVVLHVLQDQSSKKSVDGRYLRGLTEPKLVSDVLILPLGAFNAPHKLDPYGGEMKGMQGTRLVMQADQLEWISTELDSSQNVTQESSQDETSRQPGYNRPPSKTVLVRVPTSTTRSFTNIIPTVTSTTAERIPLQIDTENDLDTGEGLKMMDAEVNS